jgi:dienelactone hydrolase
VHFYFATAPFRALAADFPESFHSVGGIKDNSFEEPDAWTWCQEFASGENNFYDDSKVIPDLMSGLDSVAEVISKHGPFDGLIGFSSGASIAALVASLLEGGRKQAFDKRETKGSSMAYPKSFLRNSKSESNLEILQSPMKFAVCYSGFGLEHSNYSLFYKPRIKTPILHVIGKWDTVVSEQQSLSLAAKCRGKQKLLYHPGSHFIPQQNHYTCEVVRFILENSFGC